MGEQLDKAIAFFENKLEQYNSILKGVTSDEYREYINELTSHYAIAIYSLKSCCNREVM